MMELDPQNLDPATDLELVRELKAPKALLWACWTDPRHLPHWFVPKPHKVASCEIDLRVGGACNTTFDIEGNLMENKGVYLEVIPGEKLVFTDTYEAGWKPAPEPFMTAIVTFEDLGEGRSRYRAVARHRNPEAAESHRKMGFFEGWGTVAGQLEAHAQELETRAMVITRHIAAPVEKVMRCWTDPAILPKWFGPAGYDCKTKSIDLREGGEWTFDMVGHGQVWPNRHRYTVMRDGRISFLMDGGEEPSMEVTVTLAPEGAGTRITQTVMFPDAAGKVAATGYGAAEKGMETLGKLAAVAEG
ncbi:SRPBCC domain-containing protein [Stagnihabitans tardus]|uniref:Activator of Hsp90 ATPase homologue 1/2-like C-terminal domain-containing protein n=1 Tax=Stagnihabitans tardus TaxID=2699202 RepID=A0AAE4YGS7_9RHOB|nr:hypothetical protein [Stagnihabitans tardus]